MADEATAHNQAAYDQIAGQYASRRAGRDRSFPELRAALAALWCSASLLHVPHDQTAAALGEMRRILRPGGCLALVTAAGQGARLEPVPYAPDTQRWFFYRGPAELDEQLRGAGLAVVTMTEEITSRHWLKILAEVR